MRAAGVVAHPPLLTQQVEEVGRKHDAAVLALFDPDQHPRAVDIGDLQFVISEMRRPQP